MSYANAFADPLTLAAKNHNETMASSSERRALSPAAHSVVTCSRAFPSLFVLR